MLGLSLALTCVCAVLRPSSSSNYGAQNSKSLKAAELILKNFLNNESYHHNKRISSNLEKSVEEIIENQKYLGSNFPNRFEFRDVDDINNLGLLDSMYRSRNTDNNNDDQNSDSKLAIWKNNLMDRSQNRIIIPGAGGGIVNVGESRAKVPLNTSLFKFQRGKPSIVKKDLPRGIELTCTVGYQSQVSIFWTMNNHPLEDYDSLVEQSSPAGRASILTIEPLSRLPTATGVYSFNCTTLTDYELSTTHLDVTIPLSDKCSEADCSERFAACKDDVCVCEGRYKVKLMSKHVTCRAEAFIETPCKYKEQCLTTAEHSECTPRGWCACEKGFGRDESQKCVPTVGVRARCNSEMECADYDATCILSHCTCFTHKKEHKGRCVTINEEAEGRLFKSESAYLYGNMVLVGMLGYLIIHSGN